MARAKSSNSMTKAPTAKELADFKAQLQAEAEDLGNRVGSGTTNRIKATVHGFEIPGEGVAPAPMDIVAVDWVSVNAYYDQAYNPDNPQPPACIAIGPEKNDDLVPFDDVPDRQAESCAVCPLNEFGSDGRGKACKNSKLIAVLPPDADEDPEKNPLMTVSASPTAIKGWDGYVASVKARFKMTPVAVITEMGTKPAGAGVALTFGNPRPNDNAYIHYQRKDEARALLTQKPDFSQAESKPTKPARKKRASRRAA